MSNLVDIAYEKGLGNAQIKASYHIGSRRPVYLIAVNNMISEVNIVYALNIDTNKYIKIIIKDLDKHIDYEISYDNGYPSVYFYKTKAINTAIHNLTKELINIENGKSTNHV